MRRNRLDLMTKAERSIYDAIQEVEKIGADVKLTESIIKLSEAKDLVSDFIDSQDTEAQDSTPTDPPPVPPGSKP